MFNLKSNWIVDLTHPVRAGFGDLPGHPGTEIKSIHTHREHGRSNACLITSIHAGTHLDAPYHFIDGGLTVDQVAPDRVCGPAVLLDLSGRCAPGRGIAPWDLEEALEELNIKELAGWRIIIRSGWESLYGTPGYYRGNPHLSEAAARWLAGTGTSLVGLDFPPDAISEKMIVPAPAPVHRTLLGAGVCLLENLANLATLPAKIFTLVCLPLRLEGEGGAPARVLACAPREGDL